MCEPSQCLLDKSYEHASARIPGRHTAGSVATDRYDEIKCLEDAYGTPFYVFYPERLLENYSDIDTAFRKRYGRFIIAYSYKTNYIPYLCNLIKERGGYAEVVSRLEYELALRIGQDPKTIVFNGPLKSYGDIKLALDNGSIVNLDSFYEVEHVGNYAERHPDKLVKVGLRVNLRLSQDGYSHIQEGLGVGRFGFSVEDGGLEKAISTLTTRKNVLVNGLHGHTSTRSRSLWVYEQITRTLCDLATRHLRDFVEYINVGGGIYGRIPEEMRWEQTPTFDQYADAICAIVRSANWRGDKRPVLILEPGTAMVANTLEFTARVLDIKVIGGRNFALVNGSVHNTKPTMHKHNQPVDIVKRIDTERRDTYNVVGYTCMEKDYLLQEVDIKRLEPGDFITIRNVGAYTIVLKPPFIQEAAPILAREDEGYRVIRKRESVDGFLADYVFPGPF